MSIITFAEQHRLRLTKDDCGDAVISGRIGTSNIYEHNATELGVMFITTGKKAPRTGLFNTFRSACLDTGMNPRQIGDAEGSFTFDPLNTAQAKVAIKGIRARAKRQMTPEQAVRLAAVGFKVRTPLSLVQNAL